MKKLQISKDIALPLDAVTQTVAILAKRRVGKTYTASVLAEEMVKAELPFVALDPTGAWWGLRASADGKSEGLPVTIIGGSHGDIPLEPAAGKVIAELVVDNPGYYVIDLSGTSSNAEQDRFASDFAERLYRYKEQHKDPLHLFVDEADSFAPQRPMDGQQRMLGAFEALIRRGGIRGIGMTMITQRPAVLNKNVLTQAEVLIVLQMTAPQDQDAIDDWVKRNGTKEEKDTLMASLSSLQRGQAWIWSPAWLEVFKLVHIRERTTFNSSATPKAGEKAITPRKLAAVDIEALKGRIADTLERAKADDPKELKARIRTLERELSARPAVQPAAPERVEVPVFQKEEIDRLQYALQQLADIKPVVIDLSGLIEKSNNDINRVLATANNRPPARIPILPPPGHPAPARAFITANKQPAVVEGFTITPRQQLILDALAFLGSIQIHQADKTQLALLADASPTSSGYTNNLGALRTSGLVEYPAPGCVALTAAGQAAARHPAQPPTTDSLQQSILSRLPKPKAAILRVLIDNYPNAVEKDELAGLAGASATSSGFTNNLGSLRTLGLIEYPAPKLARALPLLFLEN